MLYIVIVLILLSSAEEKNTPPPFFIFTDQKNCIHCVPLQRDGVYYLLVLSTCKYAASWWLGLGAERPHIYMH